MNIKCASSCDTVTTHHQSAAAKDTRHDTTSNPIILTLGQPIQFACSDKTRQQQEPF